MILSAIQELCRNKMDKQIVQFVPAKFLKKGRIPCTKNTAPNPLNRNLPIREPTWEPTGAPRELFFRLWAPTAQWVKICLYRSGNLGESFRQIPMERGTRNLDGQRPGRPERGLLHLSCECGGPNRRSLRPLCRGHRGQRKAGYGLRPEKHRPPGLGTGQAASHL